MWLLAWGMFCAGLPVLGDGAVEAGCREWAEKTEKELGDGFIVVSDPPFVLAGDLSRAGLKRYQDHTVKAASQALWKKFFDKKPSKPVRILLFNGERSYRHNAKELYGDDDVSHFGYFRPSDRTMLMNIATGGGTLVHELTHALMEPDFPDCPVWFDEAMRSLFEQCSLAGGDIRGLVNWRYPELRKAIDDGGLIPLADLVKANRFDFDGEKRGLLYAQSRYLAFYLQEKKLLSKFYREFRKAQDRDPSGRKTLERVTGKSLSELQADMVKWAKTLSWR
ncbi:MAG: hypothetical protein QGH15_19360 [Kiritimatiellia bacterium]|nr:hypothetical protein [Kiritimatiellia bacterium]